MTLSPRGTTSMMSEDSSRPMQNLATAVHTCQGPCASAQGRRRHRATARGRALRPGAAGAGGRRAGSGAAGQSTPCRSTSVLALVLRQHSRVARVPSLSLSAFDTVARVTWMLLSSWSTASTLPLTTRPHQNLATTCVKRGGAEIRRRAVSGQRPRRHTRTPCGEGRTIARVES